MENTIVVAGHICLDITPALGLDMRRVEPGKLYEVGAADIGTGGVVANTGLALQKLSASVALMGMVGEDAMGCLVLDHLAKYGVHDGMIVSPEAATSYSIVLAPPGADRSFLHHPGANAHFGPEHLDMDRIARARLFHFGYPSLLQRFYQHGAEALTRMFKQIKALGVLTSLDLVAIDPASETARTDWLSVLRRTLPDVDFFVPSAEELCAIVDPQRYASWQAVADGGDVMEVIEPERDVAPLAEMALAMGARVLLVKCGVKGLLLRAAPWEALSPMGGFFQPFSAASLLQRAYRAPQVRSTTGAGDICIAAFLHAVLQGYLPQDCLKLAAATGALCVSAYDAISALLPLDTLYATINAGWETM